MRFYYTGAKGFLEEQKNPSLSLGGFISSSLVPNGNINNLFSSITPYTLNKNLTEYSLIALKNELGNDIKELKVLLEYNQQIQFSNIELAAIVNKNNNFELIQNSNSMPYFAEFHSPIENSVCLGDLKNNEYIGIWIKRVIKKSSFIDLYSDESISSSKFLELKKEEIKVKLNWVNL